MIEEPIAAEIEAIAEELSALAGFRFTRLTAVAALGATTVNVETTFGWPSSGKFVHEKQVYSYTSKTLTTLSGITYEDGGTQTGLRGAAKREEVVLDFSQTFSAIDQTVNHLFVDSASGAALSVVGRNLGVDRPIGLEDDATFRKVIKAIAYTRRGAMQALEVALTAFFGAGNFEVFENLPTYNNTVFIRITGGPYAIAADVSAGKTYLTKHELLPLTEPAGTVPLTGPLGVVEGIRLADEKGEDSFTAVRPSALTEIRYIGDSGIAPWQYAGGGGAETAPRSEIVATDGGYLSLTDDTNAHTSFYFRTARVLPESDAVFETTFLASGVPSSTSTSGLQAVPLRLQDGEVDICIGLIAAGGFALKTGLVDPATGSFIGSEFFSGSRMRTDVWESLAIRKSGTDDRIEILRNGAVAAVISRAACPASTKSQFSFGLMSTALNGAAMLVKNATYQSRTSTDFWNAFGSGTTTAATTLDTGDASIGAGDVGKPLRTHGAPTTKNNGAWRIATAAAGVVTLGGYTKKLAILESAHPARVRIAHDKRAFKFPDDVGKKVDLTAAVTSPNAGTYVIASILDPLTNVAFSGASVDYSDRCEVTASPGFVTETEIDWKLVPNFANEAGVLWEMSAAGSVAVLLATLRDPPVIDETGAMTGFKIIMDAVYTQVDSAQLLPGREVANDPVGAYFPAYLPPDLLGPFRAFLRNLTVAGVLPEVAT